jgi:hypothetical protein
MIAFIAQLGKALFGQCGGGMHGQLVQSDLARLFAWVKEQEQKMDQTVDPVNEALDKSFMIEAC